MLERIEEIQGIGLLYQVNGKPHGLKKATLIYADNGRGKSTLATILRSVSTGNSALVTGMKTVDGTLPQKVVLQFNSGHKVTFENGAWSEKRPELFVFDADFVARNVHSGGVVNTEHRKNLLEFALGEGAVQARQDLDDATGNARKMSEEVKDHERQLSGYHTGLTLDQFEKLPQVSDLDAKITGLERRIKDANDAARIQARPLPDLLQDAVFDIDGLFATLGQSLDNIHANADTLVREHIAKLGGRGAEAWLSQGQQFDDGRTCPYCEQDISTNDLVSAYQTHFNAAYRELKARIATWQDTVSTATTPHVIEGFAQNVELAATRADGWSEQVQTEPISFDSKTAGAALSEIQRIVLDLLQRKAGAPAEPLGTQQERDEITNLWQQVHGAVRSANTSITVARDAITGYRNRLTNENAADLQRQLHQLQATKRRHDPTVVDLFTKLNNARQTASKANDAMRAARTTLDSLMTATLEKYQTSINSILKSFGASFSIKNFSANFRGNAPRSEYGIELRGKDVPLEGGPPSFTTALSDGDKRTLAFAFFIASVLNDSAIANRIVVIDDPMSSLDANRRHQTRTYLKKIRSKAQQLIVLAHDAFFLRDLRDAFWKEDKTAPLYLFQMVACQSNCTAFAQLDIDKECESEYSRHHRALYEYASGNGGDARAVAKAIRPFLEGYLHRRFPGLLPKDQVFGNIVVMIRDSTAPCPLSFAKNLVNELNEINDYAGQFHHDTNASADSVSVTASELATFVQRALCVVHKSAPLN